MLDPTPQTQKERILKNFEYGGQTKKEKKGKNGLLDKYLINGPPMSVVLLTKCPEPFAGVGYN
jgi:hypothetical protein